MPARLGRLHRFCRSGCRRRSASIAPCRTTLVLPAAGSPARSRGRSSAPQAKRETLIAERDALGLPLDRDARGRRRRQRHSDDRGGGLGVAYHAKPATAAAADARIEWRTTSRRLLYAQGYPKKRLEWRILGGRPAHVGGDRGQARRRPSARRRRSRSRCRRRRRCALHLGLDRAGVGMAQLDTSAERGPGIGFEKGAGGRNLAQRGGGGRRRSARTSGAGASGRPCRSGFPDLCGTPTRASPCRAMLRTARQRLS